MPLVPDRAAVAVKRSIILGKTAALDALAATPHSIRSLRACQIPRLEPPISRPTPHTEQPLAALHHARPLSPRVAGLEGADGKHSHAY